MLSRFEKNSFLSLCVQSKSLQSTQSRMASLNAEEITPVHWCFALKNHLIKMKQQVLYELDRKYLNYFGQLLAQKMNIATQIEQTFNHEFKVIDAYIIHNELVRLAPMLQFEYNQQQILSNCDEIKQQNSEINAERNGNINIEKPMNVITDKPQTPHIQQHVVPLKQNVSLKSPEQKRKMRFVCDQSIQNKSTMNLIIIDDDEEETKNKSQPRISVLKCKSNEYHFCDNMICKNNHKNNENSRDKLISSLKDKKRDKREILKIVNTRKPTLPPKKQRKTNQKRERQTPPPLPPLPQKPNQTEFINKNDCKTTKMHTFISNKMNQQNQCSFCRKRFENKNELSKHKKKFHEESFLRSFVCVFCAKPFKDMDRLNQHINNHLARNDVSIL